MEDAEESHFDAEKEGRNADLYVWGLDSIRSLDGAGRGEKRYEKLKRRASADMTSKNGEIGLLTVCQNDKNMTSLIAATFMSGWCSAKSCLIWK